MTPPRTGTPGRQDVGVGEVRRLGQEFSPRIVVDPNSSCVEVELPVQRLRTVGRGGVAQCSSGAAGASENPGWWKSFSTAPDSRTSCSPRWADPGTGTWPLFVMRSLRRRCPKHRRPLEPSRPGSQHRRYHPHHRPVTPRKTDHKTTTSRTGQRTLSLPRRASAMLRGRDTVGTCPTDPRLPPLLPPTALWVPAPSGCASRANCRGLPPRTAPSPLHQSRCNVLNRSSGDAQN